MDKDNLNIGDEVAKSPVGPGKVTGFHADGYPEVNGKAVGRLERTDGALFGPFGNLSTPTRKVSDTGNTNVAPMTTTGNPGLVPGTEPAPATPPAPATAPPAGQPATQAPTPATGTPSAPSGPAAAPVAHPQASQGVPARAPTAGLAGEAIITAVNSKKAAASGHPATHAVPGPVPEVASGDAVRTHVPAPAKS